MAAQRLLVAMSGGVDSAAAAALLTAAGYTCLGATMRLYEGEADGESHTCCTLADVEDARAVAARLGMPYYVFNFCETFRQEVIGRFAAAYAAGSTPNPCIDCNRYMKFDRLMEKARLLDCNGIATGHYARVRYDRASGRYQLLRARCAEKDQSYVLYMLTQQQLAAVQFPLGEIGSKAEVRAIAAQYGLVNANKPDSQDICFVPDGDYAAFLEQYTGHAAVPGDFVDRSGRVLGRHRGLIRYTVGQRRGLGLSLKAPLYVCEKRADSNTVVLGEESELWRDTFFAAAFNWIMCPPPDRPVPITVMTRYRAKEIPGIAQALPDGRVKICCDQPLRAITPGQAVVLYDGERVVGGGTIL